jgi:hypothetical protein
MDYGARGFIDLEGPEVSGEATQDFPHVLSRGFTDSGGSAAIRRSTDRPAFRVHQLRRHAACRIVRQSANRIPSVRVTDFAAGFVS